MKSLAPERMASMTMVSWPMAEHMTTLAPGSEARMALRASRPSMLGMVMSMSTRSGLRELYFSTASAPSTASWRSV